MRRAVIVLLLGALAAGVVSAGVAVADPTADAPGAPAEVRDRGARLATAVSWAGPMDLHLVRYGPQSHPYIEQFLDCVGRPCDEAKIVAASPISHVDAGDPPMLLVQGEEDLLVPPDQGIRMGAALDQARVPHELLLVPNAGHDERVIPPAEQPSFDFLRRELGGVEPSRPVSNGGGGGGDGMNLAPLVAVVIAALVVGALVVVLVFRTRRRVRY